MLSFKSFFPFSVRRLYHLGWAVLSIILYGRPSKNMVVIGVTGTDGKTTTTTFLYEILKQAGLRVGMINGLKFVLPSKEWKNKSDNSTPGRLILRKFLRDAKREDCDVVILEVTSWGLEQFRVFRVAFDVAVFTNLSHEHLDLHGSMQRYRAMKGKLFKALQSPKKKNQEKVSVVNREDDSAMYFSRFKSDKTIMFGEEENAQLQASNIQQDKKLSFDITSGDKPVSVSMNILGRFNVSNALAAAGAALAVGLKLKDVKKGLEAVAIVPGRMESVDEGQDFHVIVDFAHTPQGFESLFEAARDMVGPDNKIIAVYGATGGRDTERRPMVGEIAGNLVDYSVLTSEDPREEDPRKIAEAIEEGLKKVGRETDKDYTFIHDRAEAIQAGVDMAEPGDAVLLCSMGDYDVMYVGKGKVPWSDREAAKKALRKRLGKK